MSSQFSQHDEYGFLRPDTFNYQEYEAFMSDYLGVLTRRRQKWEVLVRGGYSKLSKGAKLKRYVRKGIPSTHRRQVWMEVSGAAASAQPEAAGQYLVTDVWSAGHRVFMHSQRNLVLSKVPGFTNWAIRQSLASTAGCVQSAAASWCPADCRATFSERDELGSWRFSDSEGWKEGDIKVYCETHKPNSSKDQ